MRILVIEDEKRVADLLKRELEDQDYSVGLAYRHYGHRHLFALLRVCRRPKYGAVAAELFPLAFRNFACLLHPYAARESLVHQKIP